MLMEKTGKRGLLATVFALLVLWNSLGGLEVIRILKGDPRILAREEVDKFLDNKNGESWTVGVLGSSLGYGYIIGTESYAYHPMQTVRDWSEPSFGIISPDQLSLVCDSFPLLLVRPRILLGKCLSRVQFQEIRGMGYCLLKEILPVRRVFNRFAALPDVRISIFVLDVEADHPPKSKLSLEEQLMVIHYLRKGLKWDESLLKKMGELANNFYEPDISNKIIEARDIELLAIGYHFAGKKESVVSAFNFLCSKWPSQEHFHNRDVCFRHFGVATNPP